MKVVDDKGNDLTTEQLFGVASCPTLSAIDSVDVFVGGKLLRTYDLVGCSQYV